MRPTNTKSKNQADEGAKAPVVSLSSYRSRTPIPDTPNAPSHDDNVTARHSLVRTHLIERSEAPGKPTVAAAVVLLRTDGTVDTSAIGIEPEYIRFITRGLDRLSATLRGDSRHADPRAPDGGIAVTALLVSLSFVAATYINQAAWLDATLSIAAQLIAAKTWRRRS